MEHSVFVAGYSDTEDEDDFGFWATVNSRKKRQNKAPKSAAPVNETPSVSKVVKKPAKKVTFWQKKEAAFQKFGEATVRPQKQYRTFLLHRRRINNGKFDDLWTENPQAKNINRSNYPQMPHVAIPLELYGNQLVVVNEENSFMKMIQHLSTLQEITVDLEANEEHSYLGMTVMIQIGTEEFDFIIDCFPVTSLINEHLKKIFESEECVKYLYGADNDILWLQRDFLIYLTGAIDIQVLMDQILKLGHIDQITASLPFNQKKTWYHEHIGPRRNSTPQTDLRAWETQASTNRISYEAFVSLFHPSLQIDKDAQLADFRPRDLEDKHYQALLKYARNDVHVLLNVIRQLKMQDPKLMEELMKRTFELTKVKLRKTYKRKQFSSPGNFISSNKKCITEDKVPLLEMIYNWRSMHAKMIDENPQSMFMDRQMIQLVNQLPKTENEVDDYVSSHIGKILRIPESIGSWRTCLFKLLTEGMPYFGKITSIKCHNCHETGHAAWGCEKEWSTESTKANLKENPAAKSRQNHRRQIRKRANAKKRKQENTP